MGITQEVEGAGKKNINALKIFRKKICYSPAKFSVSHNIQYPKLGFVRPWSNRVRLCFHNIIYIAAPWRRIEATKQKLWNMKNLQEKFLLSQYYHIFQFSTVLPSRGMFAIRDITQQIPNPEYNCRNSVVSHWVYNTFKTNAIFFCCWKMIFGIWIFLGYLRGRH